MTKLNGKKSTLMYINSTHCWPDDSLDLNEVLYEVL